MSGRVVPMNAGTAELKGAMGVPVDNRQPVVSGEVGVLDADWDNWSWGENDDVVVEGAAENPEVCDVCN